MKTMEDQINIFEYMAKEYPKMSLNGCGNCICRHCLYWWSNRCPFGKCWDDHRAQVSPYDKAHPDGPQRTGWSNWKTDQAYWCRGGVCYPAYECEIYVKYTGQRGGDMPGRECASISRRIYSMQSGGYCRMQTVL